MSTAHPWTAKKPIAQIPQRAAEHPAERNGPTSTSQPARRTKNDGADGEGDSGEDDRRACSEAEGSSRVSYKHQGQHMGNNHDRRAVTQLRHGQDLGRNIQCQNHPGDG